MAAKKQRKENAATPVGTDAGTGMAAEAGVSTRAARPPQQSAAAVKAERKREKLIPVAAFAVLILTLGSSPELLKADALFATVAALAVLIWRRKRLAPRFGTVALALVAYCLAVSVSAFYAPAGKLALQESLQLVLALAVFALVLAIEPAVPGRTGRFSAAAVELCAAAVSALSIDLAAAPPTASLITRLLARADPHYFTLMPMDGGGRITSIFDNVNIFAGVAGLGILLGLALLDGDAPRRARRFHLACLCVNVIAFLTGFSRGAMAVLVLVVLVCLFLERGTARGHTFAVLMETGLFSGAAALVCVLTKFGSVVGGRFLPLAVVVAAAAGLLACDRFVGTHLGDKFAAHPRATLLSIVGLLGAVALFAVAALNLTGPATVGEGRDLTRAVYPAPGENTLRIQADGLVGVRISCQRDGDAFSGKEVIYDGVAENAKFTVPDDALVVTLYLYGNEPVTITDLRCEGARTENVRLRYLLLPESIAARLQGLFQSESFLLRKMLWRTGLSLWRESPVIGLGVGAFQVRGMSAMNFHYETKYVHNHYIQTLLDVGVIGLVLFAGVLFACARALLLARRRESEYDAPFRPALAAALLFMAGQAVTDVIFSAGFYLPTAFAVFAIIALSTDDTLPGRIAPRWTLRVCAALLALWLTLNLCNLWAQSLCKNPSYKDLQTAAKVDFFERNDYLLSYVVYACEEDERSAEMDETIARYMEKLETAESDTIPRYLAICRFRLGEPEKAFAMLQKYVAYSPYNAEAWDDAFGIAADFRSDSPAFADGVRTLSHILDEQNADNIVPVTLSEETQQFISEVTENK